EQLLYGQGPYPDLVGTPDEIRARLAGAVPLLRNIERCLWEFYRGDEFIDTYSGLVFEDIPAYAQIEIILTNGQYASWMFEIDSVLGNDPSTDGSGNADGSVDGEDDADDTNGGNGQPGNDDGGGRRPGGQINPNATRVINISDS
ncbi:MAG: hypothetical protein JKX70_05525, partial [Phycisphaerales bacterium]|nr:hypothetical protein [Phycisphaerales bacterium]